MRNINVRLMIIVVCGYLCHPLSGWRLQSKLSTPHRVRFPCLVALSLSTSSSTAASVRSSNEKSLFDDDVTYFDFANDPRVDLESLPTRSLPLFVLNTVQFPASLSRYNIFEMKYRTMMFHISQKDDMFGIILSHPVTGQLATIGTLCKVIERQLNEDGTQFIQVQGVQRFQLVGIEKTSPYVTGLIHLNITDQPIPQSEDVNYRSLELETYSYLKLHHRLIRKLTSANISLPVEFKQFRPLGSSSRDPNDDNYRKDVAILDNQDRRTSFSFALASFVSLLSFGLTNLRLGFEEAQMLLQTTDLLRRMQEEKKLLKLANDFLTQIAIQAKLSTQSEVSLMKEFAFQDMNDDDLYPEEYSLNPFDDKPTGGRNEKVELKSLTASGEKDEWDLSNMM